MVLPDGITSASDPPVSPGLLPPGRRTGLRVSMRSVERWRRSWREQRGGVAVQGIQYRPGLVDGCLTCTGLTLEARRADAGS
jgi:hypothetical protein